MNDKIVFGMFSKNKTDINSNNYKEDKDLIIILDGINNDKKQFNIIKELYNKRGEKFLEKIEDFYSIYLYDKKKI